MNNVRELQEVWNLVAEALHALKHEIESDGTAKAIDVLTEANFLLQQHFLEMDSDVEDADDEQALQVESTTPEDQFVREQKVRAILTRVGEISPLPGAKDENPGES